MRKEFTECRLQFCVMCRQQLKRRTAVRKVRRTLYQSGETIFYSPDKLIIKQPVIPFHIRENIPKGGGQNSIKGTHSPVHFRGEFHKTLVVFLGKILRQEMIVDDIHESGTIQAVYRFEYPGRLPGQGMTIGIGIDRPVEVDPREDQPGVIEFFPAFNKIADEVAGDQFRVSEGEVCMCEKIHDNNLQNY